jgi:hypothetical protein
MQDIAHVKISNNGVEIHAAIQGAGPLVLLCHGPPTPNLNNSKMQWRN